jgi:hypothetical protein
MKRRCTLATLVLALTAGAPCAAAAPPAVLESAPPGTVVLDDDGGRAQIVPRAGAAASAAAGADAGARKAAYHGGPVVASGSIQALFLGSAWREEASRAMESRILEALSGNEPRSPGHEEPVALSRVAREDPMDPLEGHRISDLEIQARLDELLGQGAIGPLEDGAVFVVFLAPGIRSTLGASASDKDFAAYHNFFHVAAGVVRYAVVPYDAELSRWLANARQSLVQTLINPEGTGWY